MNSTSDPSNPKLSEWFSPSIEMKHTIVVWREGW